MPLNEKDFLSLLDDIKSKPAVDFHPSLNSDQMIKLAQAIEESTSLQSITIPEISKADADDKAALALAVAFKKNISLKSIDLNLLWFSDEGEKYLVAAFKEKHSLRDITLSNITIKDDEVINNLAAAIANNTSLQSIKLRNLRGKGFTDDEKAIYKKRIKALAQALQKSPTIKKIDLGANYLGDEGAKIVAEVIEKSISLQNVILDANFIGDEGVQALSQGIVRSSSLKSICLYGCEMTVTGATALAKAIEKSSSLHEIDIGKSGIGKDKASIMVLSTAIAKSRSLRIIRLSYVSLMDESSAKTLIDIIAAKNSLQTVDLSATCDGTNGAKFLAHIILTSTSLQNISFEYNMLADDDARFFSNAIAESTLLRSLNLGLNFLRDAGALEMAHALVENQSLQEVDLSSNHIGDSGAKNLIRAFLRSKTLQELKLNGNHVVDPEIMKDLEKVMLLKRAAVQITAFVAGAAVTTVAFNEAKKFRNKDGDNRASIRILDFLRDKDLPTWVFEDLDPLPTRDNAPRARHD